MSEIPIYSVDDPTWKNKLKLAISDRSHVTKRDLKDAFVIALVQSTTASDLEHIDSDGLCPIPGCDRLACKLERGELEVDDVYRISDLDFDPIAVANNMLCEVEKRMGIYPNTQAPEETP